MAAGRQAAGGLPSQPLDTRAAASLRPHGQPNELPRAKARGGARSERPEPLKRRSTTPSPD